MKKTGYFLLFTIIAIVLISCTTPDESVIRPETTERISTATTEPQKTLLPTEVPTPVATATGDTDAEEVLDYVDPAEMRFPLLQIADGSSIDLSPYDVTYYANDTMSKLQEDYAAIMNPRGCVVATDVGGDGGIGDGYLCEAVEGAERFHFLIWYAFETEEYREVYIRFGSPETPDFDTPIPDEAVDVYESRFDTSFYVPGSTFNLADYLIGISEQNCQRDEQAESPEGYDTAVFICLDETDRPISSLYVSASEYDNGYDVYVSVGGLIPTYKLTGFPEGAQDFSYAADGSLVFSTMMTFEDVYAFYTVADTPFTLADCILAGETGGAGGATAMQFRCTDTYNAVFAYDYLITIVISESEVGVAVQMIFELE